MSKSIKIILIFLVVAGVVGAGVYFGTRGTTQPTPSTGGGEETSLPGVPAGGDLDPSTSSQGANGSTEGGAQVGEKVGEVVDVLGAKILYKEPVLGFSPTQDGGIILVNKKGVVVSIDPSGEKKELNNSEIDNPLSAVFSTDSKKILVSYGKVSAPQFSVYDVASSTWQPILSNVAATIRPSTYEVVYLYEKNGLKNLLLWDLKKPKSTPQQISSFQIEDPVLSWKDKDTLLINERPSAYVKGSILAFSLSKKTVTPLIKSYYIARAVYASVYVDRIMNGINNSDENLKKVTYSQMLFSESLNDEEFKDEIMAIDENKKKKEEEIKKSKQWLEDFSFNLSETYEDIMDTLKDMLRILESGLMER
jgi:hypothetical protein